MSLDSGTTCPWIPRGGAGLVGGVRRLLLGNPSAWNPTNKPTSPVFVHVRPVTKQVRMTIHVANILKPTDRLTVMYTVLSSPLSGTITAAEGGFVAFDGLHSLHCGSSSRFRNPITYCIMDVANRMLHVSCKFNKSYMKDTSLRSTQMTQGSPATANLNASDS